MATRDRWSGRHESYYYSRTRLAVEGELAQGDGPPVHVSGLAWMDHQWGNFVVAGAGGWDWYSLQLDDRSELMLYVLRGPDGQTTGVIGTQVLPDGSSRDVAPDSVSAQATGSWTSPHTGAAYPSGWRLVLPDGQRLEVTPQLSDQELYFPAVGAATSDGTTPASSASATTSSAFGSDSRQRTSGTTMTYWEGAVTVSGDRSGVGYVELTGYATS
ncbi:MAG: carotenoid 1,2-hydratase [Chloroflexi bacterium]|nr:carotenoid 1,2-hydratase [Chloroflexota bacterium]